MFQIKQYLQAGNACMYNVPTLYIQTPRSRAEIFPQPNAQTTSPPPPSSLRFMFIKCKNQKHAPLKILYPPIVYRRHIAICTFLYNCTLRTCTKVDRVQLYVHTTYLIYTKAPHCYNYDKKNICPNGTLSPIAICGHIVNSNNVWHEEKVYLNE